MKQKKEDKKDPLVSFSRNQTVLLVSILIKIKHNLPTDSVLTRIQQYFSCRNLI